MIKLFRNIPVIFACLSIAGFTTAQTNPSLPYLYYYSLQNKAFIVERADGSDARILAPYNIPDSSIVTDDGAAIITGPGWSFSGTWFAWTTRYRNGVPGQVAFVLNKSDAAPVEINRDYFVINMEWSPAADLLLMHLRTGAGEVDREIVQIYNPDAGVIVAEFDAAEILNNTLYLRRVDWTPDGNSILIANTQRLSLIDISGQVIDSPDTLVSPADCRFDLFPYWLNHHHLAYLSSDGSELLIKNMSSGEEVVSVNLPEGEILLADWSPDNNMALLYLYSPANDYELWLLSLTDMAVKRISEAVFFTSNCGEPFTSTLWGSNSQAAYISGNSQLYILNAIDSDSSPVTMPTNTYWKSWTPVRWADGGIIFLSQREGASGNQIYSYLPRTNTLTLLTPQNESELVLGTFLSTVKNGRIIYDGTILDVTTGHQHQIMRNPQNIEIQFVTEDIQWETSGEWLIALASPHENLYRVYVANTEGTGQRELTRCPLRSASCYGWIPPQRG